MLVPSYMFNFYARLVCSINSIIEQYTKVCYFPGTIQTTRELHKPDASLIQASL